MKTVAVADACDLITDGTHYTPPDVGTGIPFLTVKDMSSDGLNFEGCARIEEPEFEAAAKQNSVPRCGDVLFSKDGTVGKVHVVSDEPPFAILSSIAILRPNKKILHSNFLAHFLRSPALLSLAERRKTGSALRRIILKDIKQLEIPLPPLAEQRRIAAILDQADALRRLRRRALDRLNTLGQAIFHEMFGNKADTLRCCISEFAAVKGGKRLPKGAEYSQEATAHPYIRVSDLGGLRIETANIKYITPDIHQAVKRYIVAEGDVVISIAGTIGVTAAVPPALSGANLTENAAKITPKAGAEFDQDYLAWALSMPEAQGQITSRTGQVTIGKLALFRIEQIEIPMPPIERQREFSSRVSKVENHVRLAAKAEAKIDCLFAALQHRAFRGGF